MERLEDIAGTSSEGSPLAVAELRRLIEKLLGGSEQASLSNGGEKLNSRVWRLLFETVQGPRSLMVKRLAPEVARRNAMVVTRWLPAVGMSENGPVLLGMAAEHAGGQVWHVYEDHGHGDLSGPAPEPRRVSAAVGTIAQLHVRFASHALLGECRLWGGDMGMHFYTSSVRDAIHALASLEPPAVRMAPDDVDLKERLLVRLRSLHRDAPRRAKLLEEEGGPETFLHGDLWTKNVFVLDRREGLEVRLIDWDHAGVGPASYDLSTFLFRFPPHDRASILEVYRGSVEESGWRLPSSDVLNILSETAEIARIANRLIWPAIAIRNGERWGWPELREVEMWFEALQPLLPCAQGDS